MISKTYIKMLTLTISMISILIYMMLTLTINDIKG